MVVRKLIDVGSQIEKRRKEIDLERRKEKLVSSAQEKKVKYEREGNLLFTT